MYGMPHQIWQFCHGDKEHAYKLLHQFHSTLELLINGVFVHYDYMYTTIATCEPDKSRLRGGEIHAAFPSQSDLLLVVVLENS